MTRSLRTPTLPAAPPACRHGAPSVLLPYWTWTKWVLINSWHADTTKYTAWESSCLLSV